VEGAQPGGDGTVNGNLYLVGGGDPILSTANYANHFVIHSKIHTSLEALADAVVKAGVKHVSGQVVGDDSRYDAQRYVASWPARYATQNQSGPISALSVNDGFTSWPDHEGPNASDDVPATNPPANAADQFAQLLTQRGVTVGGGTAAGTAPAGLPEIAGIDSPPLSQVIQELLTGSDNQTAESIVKELGVLKGSGGTTAAGMQVVNAAVAKLGLSRTGSVANDGSGLDGDDKVTCAMLTGILDRSGRHGIIAAGLPVGGTSGTLSDRFTDPAVKGRIHAKTGTLTSVSALTGFVDTTQGPSLTFSYIASGRTVDNALLKIQDTLGADLVQYPQGPTLAQLGPR
jgi:D-alanyl-D-alanine carboxypeptidase/D-alanyl-D-alanine-endopeptidase (penicillin-binding protein 4)